MYFHCIVSVGGIGMARVVFPADVLDRMENLLKAQLEALQQLRSLQVTPEDVAPVQGRRRKLKRVTQMDLAYQVLVLAGTPLHVYEMVRQIQLHFGVVVKWESVVSTLAREAAKGQRFVRTGKNTFGIVGRDDT